MTSAEALAARLRKLLTNIDGIAEKKMFGGYGYMLHGNMLVGAMKGGELLVRVSPESTAEALSRPGTAVMKMGERTMVGFVAVIGPAIAEDDQIARWIAFAEPYVRSMPPK